MLRRRSASGFTLIELLIVVAIIAILAAIAVPNFLEAQTRAKVSRVKADLRTILTGVETYRIDNNQYPLHMLVDQKPSNIIIDPWLGTTDTPDWNEFHFSRRVSLTTPVSYVNTIPPDPFYKWGQPINPGSSELATGNHPKRTEYLYANSKYRGSAQTVSRAQAVYGELVLWSGGPDLFRRDVYMRANSKDAMRIYDASNGTLSVGDIWRTQKNPDGSRPTVPGVVD